MKRESRRFSGWECQWYSTQPSVTRLAQDRAEQYDVYDVWAESWILVLRLRADRNRGELAGVHIAPDSSSDVPDEMEARLVVLGPERPHAGRNQDSEALSTAREILAQRGSSPRLYKNTLVFMAPDERR
jgi:uncharacterized protein